MGQTYQSPWKHLWKQGKKPNRQYPLEFHLCQQEKLSLTSSNIIFLIIQQGKKRGILTKKCANSSGVLSFWTVSLNSFTWNHHEETMLAECLEYYWLIGVSTGPIHQISIFFGPIIYEKMRMETNLTRCISINCNAIFPQVQRFRGPNVKIDSSYF